MEQQVIYKEVVDLTETQMDIAKSEIRAFSNNLMGTTTWSRFEAKKNKTAKPHEVFHSEVYYDDYNECWVLTRMRSYVVWTEDMSHWKMVTEWI